MSHIGEFDLIGQIDAQFKNDSRFASVPGVTGIGDDCAVIPQRDGLDTLVTTDLLIEDRHFLLGDVSPEQLGWKSAAVNISDIAAMGGRPMASFLSIALPKGLRVPSMKTGSDEDGTAENGRSSMETGACEDGTAENGPAEWVGRFISGFREMSARFGVPLLGGDTSASPDKLFINVTVLGECPHGRAVPRSGARPGDLICVTGPLGDSAAGLKLILDRASLGLQDTVEETLIRRHYLPMPRVAEGQALASIPGVHSMMDVSDGIASDLRHILEASGCAAEVDLASLPLSDEMRQVCAERGWDAAELAVSGGEDYELLFTIAPEALEQAREALGGRVFPIGKVLPAPTATETPAAAETAAPAPAIDHSAVPAIDHSAAPAIDHSAAVAAAPSAEKVSAASADLPTEPPAPAPAKTPAAAITPATAETDATPAIRWIGSDKDFKGFSHF